jgi:hypothetical protein
VVAERGGEVDRSCAVKRADGEVAQGGHDVGAAAGADLGGVLGEGHIPHPVQPGLDPPVPAQQISQPGGAGLGVGQAGDRVDDRGPPPPAAKVADLPGDLEDLAGVREAEPADGDGLEGADLHPAVGAVAGAVQDRHPVPGQPGTAGKQRGPVGLDGKQIVSVLGFHEELCGIAGGLERIGGDHGTGQVQALSSGWKPGT